MGVKGGAEARKPPHRAGADRACWQGASPGEPGSGQPSVSFHDDREVTSCPGLILVDSESQHWEHHCPKLPEHPTPPQQRRVLQTHSGKTSAGRARRVLPNTLRGNLCWGRRGLQLLLSFRSLLPFLPPSLPLPFSLPFFFKLGRAT